MPLPPPPTSGAPASDTDPPPPASTTDNAAAAAGATPTPTPTPSLIAAAGTTPRRRLAALSAVVAVMVALPMAQVLRYQASELAAVRLEQAGLDPMARAVEVQAGVIGHRDLAGRVLRGDTEAEPQRRLQQQVVDDRVADLSADLATDLWPQARAETDALRGDWSTLVLALTTRRIDPAGSDLAHRLLVEQSLQIIDDLGLGGAVHRAATAKAGSVTGAAEAGAASGPSHGPTAAEWRQLRALPHAMWRQAQRRSASAEPTQIEMLQRFRALHTVHAERLTAQVRRLEHQRLALAGAMALLTASAIALLLSMCGKPGRGRVPDPLLPDTRTVRTEGPGDDPGHAPSESSAVAMDALSRMRRARDGHSARAATTLPPEPEA